MVKVIMDEPKPKTSEPESLENNTPNTDAGKQSSTNQVVSGTDTAKPAAKGRLAFLGRIGNFYFFGFLVLVLVASATVFLALRWSKGGPSQSNTKVQSLTDKQLAALKGSTTLVGDSSQVLDIQGNSVFESQVLLRKDLDVAGSIKVGGALSLPSISVGGTGSFGKVQVNDVLSVAGAVTLQNQLNVQKNLAVAGSGSFSGAVSAPQLNVGGLQLTGDLQINRHITLGGAVPGRSNGTALGGGGTASVSGSDTAGTITINTGSGPPAGCFVTINFAQKFNATPHVIVSPDNSSAGTLQWYANHGTTSFSVCTNNAPAASTTYVFDYIIID